ncbi:MAG: aminomethyltransferase family protein [Myxococcales bacterium]|nr:aminomethyltransferase family protein [Myxococcales bacterium]
MLPPETSALREGAALVEHDDLARLRLTGPGAFDVLDAVLARNTPLRPGRAAPGLLLRDDGRVLADLLLCGEEHGALVLAEGLSTAALREHLQSTRPARAVTYDDLSASHAHVAVHGPFAWEVVGALAGPDVFAAPFHTSFQLEEIAGAGIRTGKLGEYAYDLLVPRSDEPTLRAVLHHFAGSHGLTTLSRPTLALAALEHGSFSLALPGAAALTPVELQLQSRLDYTRDAPGMSALRDLRARGAPGRITWFFGHGAPDMVPETGSAFLLGDHPAGRVVDAAWSPALDGVVGTALLPRPLAHAGLPAHWLAADGRRRPARTVGPPLLNNRSLIVHPLQHTHAERARIAFPPLSRLA